MRSKDDIVILGAGLAGLSAAYHLKQDYALFEKEQEPGGMARSIDKDGYVFDYDGHLLHFNNEYVFKLVSEILDGNLAPHKRDSWIYSKDIFTRYPFQANFYGLPKQVVRDCLIGLIKAKVTSPYKRPDANGNFEDWIVKTFGRGIAEHFMLPYNKKFWTVEPGELNCDWLDGFVPVPPLEDTITGAIQDNAKSYGYNSRFWYPVKGGISQLANSFADRAKNTYFNKRAVTLDQYRKEVVFEDGMIRRFKKLITTIPLPELSGILINIPDKVREAFSMLRFTSVYVVNLGIKREDVSEKHWIYYPEKDFVFYRIGFPTNFSMDVAPSGRTSIYSEVSYSQHKPIDKNKILSDTIEGLKKARLITDSDETEVCLPIDIKYGYVVYDANRRYAVSVIKDYLKRFNIHTIGRYGSWSYMSMEDVILEGKETAACLHTF